MAPGRRREKCRYHGIEVRVGERRAFREIAFDQVRGEAQRLLARPRASQHGWAQVERGHFGRSWIKGHVTAGAGAGIEHTAGEPGKKAPAKGRIAPALEWQIEQVVKSRNPLIAAPRIDESAPSCVSPKAYSLAVMRLTA